MPVFDLNLLSLYQIQYTFIKGLDIGIETNIVLICIRGRLRG